MTTWQCDDINIVIQWEERNGRTTDGSKFVHLTRTNENLNRLSHESTSLRHLPKFEKGRHHSVLFVVIFFMTDGFETASKPQTKLSSGAQCYRMTKA